MLPRAAADPNIVGTGVIGWPTRILVRRVWLSWSLAAGVSMTIASAAGLWAPATYAKETASWAAQGAGQDAVNIFLILPALLISVRLAARGSTRALLVWLGLLLYIVYSYVLYAFFVHFNTMFLTYVATLGFAFWAFLGAISTMDRDRIASEFDGHAGHSAHVLFLVLSGGGFGTLWLAAIAPALLTGQPPKDVVDVGLPVNPVHVLDLAFVLPAMVITGVLLGRRHPLGFLFAVPLLTFSVAMGAAIVAMAAVMDARGLTDGSALITAMTAVAAVAVALITTFLRRSSQS